MGDDGIDTVITHIDMGYLVTLLAAQFWWGGQMEIWICLS
jgi:hypothetical protein